MCTSMRYPKSDAIQGYLTHCMCVYNKNLNLTKASGQISAQVFCLQAIPKYHKGFQISKVSSEKEHVTLFAQRKFKITLQDRAQEKTVHKQTYSSTQYPSRQVVSFGFGFSPTMQCLSGTEKNPAHSIYGHLEKFILPIKPAAQLNSCSLPSSAQSSSNLSQY